ncbi:hypothetical protein [Botrimarina sp.]|uniref:hypothetical protein n=1 Tax=Botrimarina sp. TaxID=2795802 RepID=UPI0032ED1581
MPTWFARLTFCGLAIATSTSLAQTVFINEDFESYGSTSAMNSRWAPTTGDGLAPAGSAGSLTAEVDGVVGQAGNAATGGAGVVNELVDGFSLSNQNGFLITPSATENIVMRGDIFIDAEFGATMRQGIGLRGDIFDRDPSGETAFGTNFVEMGTWNGSVCLPTAPDCVIGDPTAEPPVEPDANARIENDFAFRVVLFDSSTLGNYFENGVDLGQMQVSPNWQYFPLDPALDLATTVLPNGSSGNEDGLANLADIGTGWHTFEAVIGDDFVELTLDLFRDGINNVTGAAGVDASVLVEVAMAANFDAPPFDFDPAPMNSFRFGSPSGVTSDTGVAHFDNLYLALEEAAAELLGDYNGNGVVDAADYTVYRDTLGDSVAAGEGADGNNNGVIDPGDYDVWANNFGEAGSSAVATPEPTAALLVSLAGLAALGRRRG